jgi:hypothetical protein
LFSHFLVFNSVLVNKILLSDISVVVDVNFTEFFLKLSLLSLGNLINVAAISFGICKQGLLEGDSVVIIVIALFLEIGPFLLCFFLCSLKIRSLVNNCLLGRSFDLIISRRSGGWGLRRSHCLIRFLLILSCNSRSSCGLCWLSGLSLWRNSRGSLRFLIILCRSSRSCWFRIGLRCILRNIICRTSWSGGRGIGLSRGSWSSCSCGFVVSNTLWKSSLRFIIIHWGRLRSRSSGGGLGRDRLLSRNGCCCGSSLGRCRLLSWSCSGCSLRRSRLLRGNGCCCGSSSSFGRSRLLGRDSC